MTLTKAQHRKIFQKDIMPAESSRNIGDHQQTRRATFLSIEQQTLLALNELIIEVKGLREDMRNARTQRT